MTALRRRMLEDMQVRNLSAGTQQVYLQHVSRFARYCGRSPAEVGPAEIRAYQLYLRFCCNFGPATSGWTVFDNDWTGSPIMPSDNPFKWRQFEPGLGQQDL